MEAGDHASWKTESVTSSDTGYVSLNGRTIGARLFSTRRLLKMWSILVSNKSVHRYPSQRRMDHHFETVRQQRLQHQPHRRVACPPCRARWNSALFGYSLNFPISALQRAVPLVRSGTSLNDAALECF